MTHEIVAAGNVRDDEVAHWWDGQPPMARRRIISNEVRQGNGRPWRVAWYALEYQALPDAARQQVEMAYSAVITIMATMIGAYGRVN